MLVTCIVPVIADVCRARHDTPAYLSYVVMVLRRATRYGVISREGRIGLPNGSVIAPAAMFAVKLPPELICTVNRAVMLPLSTPLGHAGATCRSASDRLSGLRPDQQPG